MKHRVVLLSILTLFLSSSSILHADIFDKAKRSFKKVGNVIGDAAKTGWKSTTAPYKAVINTGKVISGKSKPKSIFQPYRDLGRMAGNTLEGGSNLIRDPQQEIYRKIRSLSRKAGGKNGEFIFDLTTFNKKFYEELGTASTIGLANILRGSNPFQLTAAPLAGAIRAAREAHIDKAKPLPPDVLNALKPHFSIKVLSRVKYTVGKVEITLPNFIGQGQKFFGDDYAVVVDDVIVFNKQPGSFIENGEWWAHEVTHVEQYSRWGIELFALKYLSGYSAIENEADIRADKILGKNKFVRTAPFFRRAGQLGIKIRERTDRSFDGMNKHVAEHFVAQCFFTQDPRPYHYMITNTRKIIVVHAITGEWLHAGWATPPLARNMAWDYKTPNLRYAVTRNGIILTPDNFGRFQPIGHVTRINY